MRRLAQFDCFVALPRELANVSAFQLSALTDATFNGDIAEVFERIHSHIRQTAIRCDGPYRIQIAKTKKFMKH